MELQEIEVSLPDITFTLEEFNNLELTFVEGGQDKSRGGQGVLVELSFGIVRIYIP